MAKKDTKVNDIFKKTDSAEPAPLPVDVDEIEIPATGRSISTGVGLKESELEMLESEAERIGVSRNALMRYGLRYFLKHLKAGLVDIETSRPPTPKKKIKFD